ncbi:hypothetical protein Tco_1540118 [Tanacetum coccineum]
MLFRGNYDPKGKDFNSIAAFPLPTPFYTKEGREKANGRRASDQRSILEDSYCYDDDDDYTIAITLVLPTKEPINSLSMGDEHLDTIPATESDEVIKSSVENLVPIPTNHSAYDLGENSSGSTTTHSDYSLPDYEAFYSDDDHIGEKNSGSTTTHADFSKYDSFIFDLSINPFPPTDRTDFYHEELAGELAHTISLSEYDHFCFKTEPELGNLTMDVLLLHIFSPVGMKIPFLTLASSGYHSFMPGVSHRNGTFIKIQFYTKPLDESTMEIYLPHAPPWTNDSGSEVSYDSVTKTKALREAPHAYPRCLGFLKPLVLAVFVLRSQELHNPQLHLGIPIS